MIISNKLDTKKSMHFVNKVQSLLQKPSNYIMIKLKKHKFQKLQNVLKINKKNLKQLNKDRLQRNKKPKKP